jgi:hypothetical protein
MTITPGQVIAARKMLNWSQSDLAAMLARPKRASWLLNPASDGLSISTSISFAPYSKTPASSSLQTSAARQA